MLLRCVFLGLLLWTASACDRPHEDYFGTIRPKHGPKTFWYNLGGNPEWVDPNLAADSQSSVLLYNLFAGLTELHPVTLEPMPGVAKGWSVSKDGLRYVFQLRQSRWSDGTALTARDFVYSIRRLLNPETGAQLSVLLYPLQYAEQVHQRALRVEGLGPDIDEATLRAWAKPVTPLDRVLLDAARGVAFLHPTGPSDGARRQQLAQALGQRPLAGHAPKVRVAAVEDLGIRAISDHRLEMRLERPVPYWLSLLAHYVAAPVPRHLFEDLARRGVPQIQWTRPEHMVVNGPYRMTEWVFRSHITLEPNPHYWDAETPQLERIRLTMVESYNTTLNLYQAGELDHIGQSGLPAEMMDELSGLKDFRRAPMLGVYYLLLNTKRPPLDDVRVRKALSLAIDRERLVRYVTRSGQEPTASLVPDGLVGYDGLDLPLFDPDKARALLREAGYGPDRPLPPVAYKYNTSEGHKQIAEAIQQMWKEHLGIPVELANEEWRVFLKSVDSKQFQVARMAWVADYPDPNTFLELFVGDSPNNRSNWGDPQVDRLLRQAGQMQDSAKRLGVLREAEALALEQQPLIPIYVYTRSELVKPYVRNAFLNAQNTPYFKYISIDPRYYEGTPEPLPDTPPPVRRPEPVPMNGSGKVGAPSVPVEPAAEQPEGEAVP